MKREYLEEIRKKNNFSITHMARVLGISRQAYYKLIAGITRFPLWRMLSEYYPRDKIMEILMEEQKYQYNRLTSEEKTLKMESGLTINGSQSNNKEK